MGLQHSTAVWPAALQYHIQRCNIICSAAILSAALQYYLELQYHSQAVLNCSLEQLDIQTSTPIFLFDSQLNPFNFFEKVL